MPERMKAAVLVDAQRLDVREVSVPEVQPHQVLVRTTAVGICGTDTHIWSGQANYNRDSNGRAIPLWQQPQTLGHEISGEIVEIGAEVRDLKVGERVVLDQGLNCYSQRIDPPCEYCRTGDSHQCANYKEHGITGLAGGFAEYVAIAAINVVRIHGDLPKVQAALTEPLGCIVHSAEYIERASARYTFTGERRIRNMLILGSGTAGLLFLQYFRNVRGFDGNIFVADLNAKKLALAEQFGGKAVRSTGEDLIRELIDLTAGEKIHLLIEATGAGPIFNWLPSALRKQATVVLYGHGHEGVDMSLLNYLQFIEPTLLSPVGASGKFDRDGRSLTYRNSVLYLADRKVKVDDIITHTCSLETLQDAFAVDYRKPDFIKAVML